MALTAITTSAALKYKPVVPGSMGQLPAFPELAGPAANQFPGLNLDYVVCSDGRGFTAAITFPYVSDLVGDDVRAYYTIQIKDENTGGWSDYIPSGQSYTPTITGYTWAYALYMAGDTDIRLVLHGGSKDGWVSNVVTAKAPNSRIITEARDGWGIYVETIHPLVGQEVTRNFKIRVDGTDYSEADGGFSYQWYRRNPKNYAMTKISGATNKTYTPVMEDVGYELLCEVHGEGNSSFYFGGRGSEVVHMPIRVYPSYAGEDGFVLDSEYELPKPIGENLKYVLNRWEGDDETGYYDVEIPMTCANVNIVERQPGQYAFYWPVLQHDGSYQQSLGNGYTVGDLPVSLVSEATGSTYSVEYTEDNPYITVFKSSVISNCLAYFYVYPTFNDERLNATVDVIGPNIDGELVVKTSKALMPEYQVSYVYFSTTTSDGICLLYKQDGYYVRVKATETTADTYYDGTLLWNEATAIDLSGSSLSVTVKAKPAFAPLTGQGTITGTIGSSESSVKVYGPAGETGETVVYTVFLRQKAGDIIAQTQTDASGVYRFDNVPYGSYEVLVNIDGYTQEQPATVTLTAENPTATGIDYSISGTEIIATAIRDISTGKSQSGVFYTIDGRCVEQPTQRGIYIRNGRKVVR